MSDSNEWFLELISQLHAKNIGDRGRLEAIREYLKNGKEIYQSDKNYLITKYAELQKLQAESRPKAEVPIRQEQSVEQQIPKVENPKGTEVDELKRQIGYLSEKVEKFEKIEEGRYREKQITFREKSLSTTLVLSLVLGMFGISGVGHMYAGRVGKGIGILVISLIIYAIFISVAANSGIYVAILPFLMYIGIFIWQILDARKCCYKYNIELGKRLRQQGL